MKISGLLFDFGGTLDADGLHWLDRFYKIYDLHGLSHIPKDRVKEAFYWADEQADVDPGMRMAGMRDMMTRHVRWQFEKLGMENTPLEEEIAASFYKPCERILHRNRHLLEKLHMTGLRMGVISNFYGNVAVLCREFGLQPYLEVILDSAVVGLKKPDPALYRLAAEKMKLPPEEIAFVGDSFDRDIRPAKSIGMKTFWMLGDTQRNPPDPSLVDQTLCSLEDLPQYVEVAQPL